MAAVSEMTSFVYEMIFLAVASGFFICLKLLSSPKTARLGNLIGAIAMLIATVATFLLEKPEALVPIFIAIMLGSVVGVVSAKRVQMTAMPQMVAIFNGFGGLASVLVAVAECLRLFHDAHQTGSGLFSFTSWFSVAVGAITFTGSMVAFLKLQELMPTKPILVSGQRLVTMLFFAATLVALYLLLNDPKDIVTLSWLALAAGVLGVLLVIPIGGADMPVVISLLNSYSGLAALAAGFVVKSNLLIISGALVGASGVILTRIMCQAMNRSLFNVVFGAFGGVEVASAQGEEKPMKEYSFMDAAMTLNNASRVIIVPGYGLAVSQAQRTLRELADELKAIGVTVSYAIHPVAGRMPGHMNVLLAEADIPYNELFDLDEINAEFESADVAVIIGANDVVNPAARHDKSSPLYGMPILNADKAKTVIVLKRGRGRGFAGVENPLFTMDNSFVVFGDAKQSLVKVTAALKDL
jgi:H+-translocating NAD(P) transhydrogenase subunit beta